MKTLATALRRFLVGREGAAAIIWALGAMVVVLALLTGLTWIGQRTAGESPLPAAVEQ